MSGKLFTQRFAFGAILLFAAGVALAEDPQAEDPPVLGKEWTVLWDARKVSPGRQQLAEDGPLTVLTELQIEGTTNRDPFWLGDFSVDGEFGGENRNLARISGRNAAVRLGRAEDFELEGVFQAGGLGGWFLLVGWDQGHGYSLYNVSLKKSGSPWFVSEFRDSRAIDDTHKEVHRFAWRGFQPLYLSVKEKKLSLTIGKHRVVHERELPNYHTGDIILGTYDTPYGPKPIEFRSLRIRAR